MKSARQLERDRLRDNQVEYVSSELLSRSMALVRLLSKRVDSELSHTEVRVLRALWDGPRRVTELAELEGLKQPTMTLLVKRLEERGFVRRTREDGDARVVLVWIEPTGVRAHDEFRSQFLMLMRGELDNITDEQVTALALSTETLESLISCLQ
jgi:DNA-binding MarR family transcriptional regulator